MKCYNEWLQPHNMEHSEIPVFFFSKSKLQLLTEQIELDASANVLILFFMPKKLCQRGF